MSFKWQKLGLLFEPTLHSERPDWMAHFAQAPNVVILHDRVRVYFCCRPLPDTNKQYVSYCAYVDFNRNTLFDVIAISPKPVLSLGQLGTFDEFGTYPVSVHKNGNDLLAVYGGWTRCESVPFNISLGMARSKDGGNSFEKYGPGPILSYSPNEPYVVTSPKLRRYASTWYLAYTAGKSWILSDQGRPEIVYKIRIASSLDGLNWTRADREIVASRLGELEAQACPDIFHNAGRYHMFFCYRQGLDFRENKLRSYRIGYASSTDLLNWHRDDSLAGIDVSAEGWDSEMVSYPMLFRLDENIYMIYVGNGNGRSGFGLARLEGSLPL